MSFSPLKDRRHLTISIFTWILEGKYFPVFGTKNDTFEQFCFYVRNTFDVKLVRFFHFALINKKFKVNADSATENLYIFMGQILNLMPDSILWG